MQWERQAANLEGGWKCSDKEGLFVQDVSGAVHPELDIPLPHRAPLPAVDCVAERGAADRVVCGLLLLLLPGLAEQPEAVPAPVVLRRLICGAQ